MPFTTSSRSPTAQRKAAELLSTTGALVLGVGIGLILPVVGSAIGWLTIALGIVSHGWGMYAKNQVEAQAAEELPGGIAFCIGGAGLALQRSRFIWWLSSCARENCINRVVRMVFQENVP